MTSDSEVTREIVARFHQAFERHRPENLEDLIARAAFSKTRRRHRMARAIRSARLASLFWKRVASSSILAFKAKEIWTSEDRGGIRWRLRWSNREADNVWDVNIMRVRDGNIVEGLGYRLTFRAPARDLLQPAT